MSLKLMVERFLDEASLTPGADINEIMMGYYLAGGWGKFKNAKDAQQTLKARKSIVDPQVYKDQDGRARAMSAEVLNWAKANGYDGSIQAIWWTARPGILAKAVGRAVDSKRNPTDILVDFGNGEFLGLSAKSTGGKGDIGFKNPGMGTLGKELGIDFEVLIKHIADEIIKKYKLPAGAKIRKAYIRANAKIKEKTVQAGNRMLNILRDALLKKLQSMDQEALRKHVISGWLNAEEADPYYVKVTGHGENGNYSATITDPMNNEKFKAISTGKIVPVALGSDSVGISADGTRILKMRFKFESEKLASAIKLSGEPWAGQSQETPPEQPQQTPNDVTAYRKNISFLQQEEREIDDYIEGELPPVTYTQSDRLDPSTKRVVTF